MNVYEEILRDKSHTQLFVATHSPIVAAQFEPRGTGRARVERRRPRHGQQGHRPERRRPQRPAHADFHISALMGPEGVRNWQAYLDLRKQIRRAPEADKPALVARALDIAERYGFAPPPEPAAT
jgi:hypothetical protein